MLKPGQLFACYEWCLTPKYDPNNAHHRLVKKKIEEGDGLPDMATEQHCVDAMKEVGFEVIEGNGAPLHPSIPSPSRRSIVSPHTFPANAISTSANNDAMCAARDMALDDRFGGDPWWLPLDPSYNPFTFRFQMSGPGKFIVRNALWCLEAVRLVPQGTYKVGSSALTASS